jgi:hypothetical protein
MTPILSGYNLGILMMVSSLSCLFVHKEQLGSKLMTFHENCYLSIFQKSVEEVTFIHQLISWPMKVTNNNDARWKPEICRGNSSY